jgi:hypothetical protein
VTLSAQLCGVSGLKIYQINVRFAIPISLHFLASYFPRGFFFHLSSSLLKEKKKNITGEI